MIQPVEAIVTCNYCHDAPAAGWVWIIEDDDDYAARAACQECADKEGLEIMIREVVSHDD